MNKLFLSILIVVGLMYFKVVTAEQVLSVTGKVIDVSVTLVGNVATSIRNR